ncbi:MAG: hypothetical protein J5501_08445 [Ruminococcus sp.]|nr:hypothetical protein [Ruminococcus sp.]
MKYNNKFRSNLSLAAISLLLAIVVWFVISITQYPVAAKTITHIPVKYDDIQGTPAYEQGLSVISCDVQEVTVDILGSRTKVGNINNENVEAYLDASNIYSTGTKSLAIKIRSTNGTDFDVQKVYPHTATVIIDKYVTREFPVTPVTSKIDTPDGMAVNQDEITCSPETVSITGPASELDQIASVCAVINKELSLDASSNVQCDQLQFYASNGTPLSMSENVKPDKTSFNISIPVRAQKNVSLSVEISGASNNFDKSSVNFKFSANSITLASSNSMSEIPDPLILGSINLSELSYDFSKTFSINTVLEPSSFTNLSGLETVTVTLDTTGLATKDLVLDRSRIAVINKPDQNYDYSLLSQQLNITVIGPEDIINNVTAEDITADVNLIDSNRQQDLFSAPVTFSTKYSNVWAVTKKNVTIQRTAVASSPG